MRIAIGAVGIGVIGYGLYVAHPAACIIYAGLLLSAIAANIGRQEWKQTTKPTL